VNRVYIINLNVGKFPRVYRELRHLANQDFATKLSEKRFQPEEKEKRKKKRKIVC